MLALHEQVWTTMTYSTLSTVCSLKNNCNSDQFYNINDNANNIKKCISDLMEYLMLTDSLWD